MYVCFTVHHIIDRANPFVFTSRRDMTSLSTESVDYELAALGA
jgi:hypothetical protein